MNKGELAVSKELKKLRGNYTVIHDAYVRNGLDVTQIDHIVITNKNVIVIETKSNRGDIYGSSFDKQWTVKLGGKTFKVYNPLRQNYKHVKFFNELAKVDSLSLVVFSERFVRLGSMVPDNVIKLDTLISYIEEVDKAAGNGRLILNTSHIIKSCKKTFFKTTLHKIALWKRKT